MNIGVVTTFRLANTSLLQVFFSKTWRRLVLRISSLASGGGKMRDPGNEVGLWSVFWFLQISPGWNAYEIQIPYGTCKCHKVSSVVKSQGNTHSSVNDQVIWKALIGSWSIWRLFNYTFALGSSLTIALHTICLARSAYLLVHLNKKWVNKLKLIVSMAEPLKT